MTATSVHRALADERRARIVEELRAAPDGLDAHELARRVSLHANTVRFHLGVLADAQLVSGAAAARHARGRPRIVYRALPEPEADRGDEYRLLATVLTGTVAGDENGAARAADAGRAWGRYLVDRPSPLVRLDDEAAKREVAELLDQQGFAAEVAGDEIRMHRCPFHELAETHPQVVCAVHEGIVSGALAELGSDLEVGELDVFVEPDLCIARLRRNGAR